MDIREIRIDQFGCWQDVAVHSLPQGVNLIHLDDGGRPADFSRFLYGVIFGFEDHKTHAGGAITFQDGEAAVTIDRQMSSRGISALRTKRNGQLQQESRFLEAQAQASIDPRLAARFFIPVDPDVAANWTWLRAHPALIRQLMDQESASQPNPELRSVDQLFVRDDSAIRGLRSERNRIALQLEECSNRLESAVQLESQRPAPKLTLAEIEDELRMLRSQQVPLKEALLLVDKWKNWNKLRQPEGDDNDVEALREAFAKYKSSEKQKRKYQRVLTQRSPKKSRTKVSNTRERPRDTQELAVRRLLEKRDWVLKVSAESLRPDVVDPSACGSPEIRHAVGLVRAAQEASERAERALRVFTAKTGFDWSELDASPSVSRSEISADSPLADAPLSEQLEELKRRRVWVEQEYQCLLGRQSLSSQVRLWVAILFVLSIASLFGTLVVVSHVGQFVLIAMGLSGMASSGAIKMSLEKRAARKLRRAQDRLHQIDREIALVTEELWDEEEAKGLAAAREEQRIEAGHLQAKIAEANRRLDSAELAFREMLIAKGMSPTLSLDAALQHERYLSDGQADLAREPTNPKLARWVKAARKHIRRLEGECHSDAPTDLLATLDLILTRYHRRDQVAIPKRRPRDHSEAEKKRAARRELHRLDKLQHSILRRARVHDVYELESAIEKSERRNETRRKWQQLDRELSLQLDTHEDGREIRDMLEMYDAPELQRRSDELEQHRSELESMRRRQASTTPDLQLDCNVVDLQAEFAALQTQLASTESKLHELEAAEQSHGKVAVQQHRVIENRKPRFAFLQRMTGGRFDSMYWSDDRLLLANQETNQVLTPAEDSEESRLAWLALRLRLATTKRVASGQESLPLVLLADDLFTTKYAAAIYDVLATVEQNGLQILLLSGEQNVVNHLVDAGASAVRIGLRAERPTPTNAREWEFDSPSWAA